MKKYSLLLLAAFTLACLFWPQAQQGLAATAANPPEMQLAFEPTPATGNSGDAGSTDGGEDNNSAGGGNESSGTPSGLSGGGTTIYEKTPLEESTTSTASLPYLTYLQVAGATLDPSFSVLNLNTVYLAQLAEGATGAWVTATASSGTVYIDGADCTSRFIYHEGAPKTIQITVTDGDLKNIYQLTLIPFAAEAQAASALPYALRLEISGFNINYSRDFLAAEANTEIDVLLPFNTTQQEDIRLSVITPDGTSLLFNNVAVRSGYYLPAENAWVWTYSGQLEAQTTLLGVHVKNTANTELVTYYGLRLIQPTGTLIQLQIGSLLAIVNQKNEQLDVAPLIQGGHTVVPLRFIAEALGAEVSWQEDIKQVTLTLAGRALRLTIGQELAGMPLPPFIENGRTMVPLRYVSENLDCEVTWLEDTREIIIRR